VRHERTADDVVVRRIVCCVAVLAAWGALATQARAAEGDLDPSFGTGGIAATTVGGSAVASAMAIDAEGRLIVVGDAQVSDADMAVVRYLPSGAPDPAFSGDGVLTIDYPAVASSEGANAVALDAQGRILIAGYVQTTNVADIALIRLNTDGSVDSTFGPPGSSGFVRQDLYGNEENASAVALDAQGRILTVGTSEIAGDQDFVAARFDSNGILDTTFGSAGRSSVDLTAAGGDFDTARAMSIDGQGRILLGGEADPAAANSQFALARLNGDGSPDTSFGPPATPGRVTTTIGSASFISAVALDPENRIVVAGGAEDGAVFQFALARYSSDGSLDGAFSGDGSVLTSFSTDPNDFQSASDLVIDSRGQIVAAGTIEGAMNERDLALARYRTDGTLDEAFGSGGKVTLPGFAGAAVELDAQDRIVVGGVSEPNAGLDPDFGAARFIGDAIAPTATISAGPPDGSVTNDSTPTFEFSASEAGSSFGCGFDGTAAGCSSPLTPSLPLTDGTHTFGLTATDRAGNASAAATRTFTVDTLAPDVDISGKKKVKTDNKKAKSKLTIDTSEPAELTCAVDKKKPKPCDEKFKAKLKLGKHKVTVTATDPAGNSGLDRKRVKVVSKP